MRPLRCISQRALRALAAGLTLTLLAACSEPACAAVPGISGTAQAGSAVQASFDLVAAPGRVTQPDGVSLYAWGFGCKPGSAPVFLPFVPSPASGQTVTCPTMQIPGPTLIVQEGAEVSVTLSNQLPLAAGNTSILFPGFVVSAQGGVPGAHTQEAAPANCAANSRCNAVTYRFKAEHPGTYAYYSGTQSDLQIDMGLFGAVIVVPAFGQVAGGLPCLTGPYSLAASAYSHPQTCYDREFLFQWHEMSGQLHRDAEAQVAACDASGASSCAALSGITEPYRPDYFMVNGRSMPDDMDGSYLAQYPNQPYNANPQLRPNEVMLLRIVGQGRLQHPLHFDGNHVRVIARDAGLLLAARDGAPLSASTPTGTQTVNRLAGPLYFTLPTLPGETVDALFSWSGKALNWDLYGHAARTDRRGGALATGPTLADTQDVDPVPCYADANGFYTNASTPPATPGSTPNYGEYCPDHNKPIPVPPPDPSVVATGRWYAGTPYLGLQTTAGAAAPVATGRQLAPAAYAYLWHSHNAREMTTRNVYPGGMLMMLVISPPNSVVDESN
jgi:hypothetical protein